MPIQNNDQLRFNIFKLFWACEDLVIYSGDVDVSLTVLLKCNQLIFIAKESLLIHLLLLGNTFGYQIKNMSSQLQIVFLTHLESYFGLDGVHFLVYRSLVCWRNKGPKRSLERRLSNGGWIRDSGCFFHNSLGRGAWSELDFVILIELGFFVSDSRRLSLRLIIRHIIQPFQSLFVWFFFSNGLNSFV